MNNIANDHTGRNVVCKQHGIILVEAIIANVCTVMIKVSVHTMGTNLRKDLYVTQAYSAFRGRWGACIGVQDCKLCVLKTANAYYVWKYKDSALLWFASSIFKVRKLHVLSVLYSNVR